MMNIEEALSGYKSIGWDMDSTLIDSPASKTLRGFILNHPEIDHYIVTFRTGGMIHKIASDLRYSDIDISLFKNVFSVPEKYWSNNMQAYYDRMRGILGPKLTRAEIIYKLWKGFACHQRGIPVLVDDNFADTQLGCNRYFVRLFDPLWFI